MLKLTFDRKKYGKEILIDSVDADNFKSPENIISTNFYTVGCLNKCRGAIEINTRYTPFLKQSVIFMPPHQHIDLTKIRFDDGIFLFFEGEFLDQFFNDSFFIFKFDFFHSIDKPSYVNLSSEQFNSVFGLFKDIHSDIKQFRSDSEHYIRSLLYHLLIKLNRFYADQHQAHGSVNKNLNFLRFRQMLEQHIKHRHSVQEYADALNISRTHLNKLSKLYLGNTSKEVIRARLLLEAKKEILYSQKDISEIAHDLNFSDPPNFFRFFRQLTGQSPQKYRKDFSK